MLPEVVGTTESSGRERGDGYRSKQMYTSTNILLMLLCHNFKEETSTTAIMCAMWKVGSQEQEQTSLASKYELAVRFSYFQIK